MRQKKELIKTINRGGIVFMPTDTIPGLSCRAFNRLAVEKIYRIKKRNPKKPFVILISNYEELSDLGVNLKKKDKKVLEKIWPEAVSVILPVKDKEKKEELQFLHRGINSLAIRMPKDELIREVILQTGPLVSTSANVEGEEAIIDSKRAKEAFGDKIDYYEEIKREEREAWGKGGKGQPSTLIKLNNGKMEVLRSGTVKIS